MLYRQLATLTLLLFGTALFGQPANDNCANAVDLNMNSGPAIVSGTTVGALPDNIPGVSDDCKMSASFGALYNPQGVWYKIPYGTKNIYYSFIDGGQIVGLVRGLCSSQTFKNCNECSSREFEHNGSFHITGADTLYQHYLIVYPTHLPLTGTVGKPFTLEVDNEPFPIPMHNDCATPLAITLGDTLTQSYRGVPNSSLALHYKFTAEYDEVTVKYHSGSRARLRLQDINCTTLNGDYNILYYGNNIEYTGLTPGTEYIIRVSPQRCSYDYDLKFSINNPDFHDNDECTDAMWLGTPDLDGVSFYQPQARSVHTPPIDCIADTTYGVWYDFIVPASGNVKISSYGNKMLVQSHCGGTVDTCHNSSGDLKLFNRTPGDTMTIYLGRNNIENSFDGSVKAMPPIPVNDNCSNALPLSISSTWSTTEYLFGGSESNTSSECNNGGPDVWYTFTSPHNGNIEFTGLGDFYFQKDCGECLGNMYLDDDTTTIAFEPNTTYKVGFTGSDGDMVKLQYRIGANSMGNDRCEDAITINLIENDTIRLMLDSNYAISSPVRYADFDKGVFFKIIMPSDNRLTWHHCFPMSDYNARLLATKSCDVDATRRSYPESIDSCTFYFDDLGPRYLPDEIDTVYMYISAGYDSPFFVGDSISFFLQKSTYGYARRVDANSPCTSGCNGRSWDKAYKNLADVINSYNSTAYTLWVAEGTYYPDERSGATADDRLEHFHLTRDDIWVIGGFKPTSDTTQLQNPSLYPTILSGEIQQDSDSTNNSYTILTVDPGADNVLIEGVTIQDGTANGPSNVLVQRTGAGVFIHGNNRTTFRNCTFRNNHATTPNSGVGGGIISYSNALQIEQCLFYNNSATVAGGAISPQSGNAHIYNSTIANNQAGVQGAGLHSCQSNTNVYNSIFDGNVTASGTLPDISDECAPTVTKVYSSAFSNPFSSEATADANSIELASQIFNNPATGNYALKYGSAAIDAGSGAYYTSPKDGYYTARIKGHRIDMGFSEFDFSFPCGAYSNLSIDDNPIYTSTYKASGLIESTGIINAQSAGVVNFTSQQTVELNAGFEVEQGAQLNINIQNPCVN